MTAEDCDCAIRTKQLWSFRAPIADLAPARCQRFDGLLVGRRPRSVYRPTRRSTQRILSPSVSAQHAPRHLPRRALLKQLSDHQQLTAASMATTASYPGSQGNTVTITTTTTTREYEIGGRLMEFDPQYIRSPSGILKIAQIVSPLLFAEAKSTCVSAVHHCERRGYRL